jgi:hypothetical protein
MPFGSNQFPAFLVLEHTCCKIKVADEQMSTAASNNVDQKDIYL